MGDRRYPAHLSRPRPWRVPLRLLGARPGSAPPPGGAGFPADPDFFSRYRAEGALSRRLVGGLVGTVAYRYLNFTSTEVRVVSPSATYYFARGEIGGQVNLVRNQELEVNSSSYSFTGIWT